MPSPDIPCQREDVHQTINVALQDPDRRRTEILDPVQPREDLESEIVVRIQEGELNDIAVGVALLPDGRHHTWVRCLAEEEDRPEARTLRPHLIPPHSSDHGSVLVVLWRSGYEVDDVQVGNIGAQLGFIDDVPERKLTIVCRGCLLGALLADGADSKPCTGESVPFFAVAASCRSEFVFWWLDLSYGKAFVRSLCENPALLEVALCYGASFSHVGTRQGSGFDGHVQVEQVPQRHQDHGGDY